MRELLAKQQKNTERQRIVRNVLILNLALVHDLFIPTLAQEVKISISMVKKVLKEHKNEDRIKQIELAFSNSS